MYKACLKLLDPLLVMRLTEAVNFIRSIYARIDSSECDWLFRVIKAIYFTCQCNRKLLESAYYSKIGPIGQLCRCSGSDGTMMFPDSADKEGTRKVMSTIVSDYTGWTYKSGLVHGNIWE
jgi:hypothetical protein